MKVNNGFSDFKNISTLIFQLKYVISFLLDISTEVCILFFEDFQSFDFKPVDREHAMFFALSQQKQEGAGMLHV